MKVKDLLKLLATKNGNMEVYISGDPEGNDIRTIDDVYAIEVPKLDDSEQTVDALCIYPTDEIIELL